MAVEVTRTQPTYRWVLRYSSIAFVLLVLMQSYGVLVGTPQFKTLLANFGSEIPALTRFALRYYWIGCFGNAALSIGSAAYIWLKPGALEVRLKVAYGLSLLALVGAFAWSGLVLVALYQPIINMGATL